MVDKAREIKVAGTFVDNDVVGVVTLPFHDRHRRRIQMTMDAGQEFLLDLPHATYLSHGVGLVLEGGGIVLVRAADEPLLKVHCQTSVQLAKIAWHLGNRHAPVEIIDGQTLHMGEDHVLAQMVEQLGASVTKIKAGFSPEYGAYHSGHGHHHDG